MRFKKDEKIPYPKSVFFIVSNEFCERFSYYGMRTILSLYLRNILLFSEKDSTIIYHTFTMLVYFFPIFGAILSDSYLGKFRTILYVSMVYACGNAVLSLSSTDAIGLPQIPFSMIGLLLIAIGTGGIKPCVSAFGGDQFVLPQQELQLAAFFSMFYFSINAGSLISTFLTPVLREGVHCFGQESCYPLAFAVPGVLMIISIVVFASGKPLYKIRKPEGNIIVQVSRCITCAVKENFGSSKTKVDHWLDRAEPKFGKTLVSDVKSTLKVLVLFIPLPIFWALYDQQGSGWTFQATRMDGNIGFYTILPDQMQVINPFLIVLFIPLFTYVIYPALSKINLLKTPLQRMVCGGIITAISFGVSAGVSFALEATYPQLPLNGECQVRLYNPSECNATVSAPPYFDNVELGPMSYHKLTLQNLRNSTEKLDWKLTECGKQSYGEDLMVSQNQAYFYYVSNGLKGGVDSIDKDGGGLPKIRTLSNTNVLNFNYTDKEVFLSVASGDHAIYTTVPGTYQLNGFDNDLNFYLGGVYTTLVSAETNNNNNNKIAKVQVIEITKPNSVHILWLIPQYLIITAGEIMFSITGLELSYSQAPSSMKSVLTAAFLLTTAFGNLIIVIIESAKFFDRQSYDFLLYSALMVVDMVIFAFMAMKYEYVNNKDESSELDDEVETARNEKNGRYDSNSGAIDNPAFRFNDNDD